MTAATKHSPERAQARPAKEQACLGGAGTFPQKQMLKFVAGPDGGVYLDVNHKLAGESAYVSPTAEAAHKAISTGAITARLGTEPITDPKAFKRDIFTVLERRFFERAGIARKAGQGMLGSFKGEEAIKNKVATHIFHAADTAPNSLKKLEAGCVNANIPFIPFAGKTQWEKGFDKANCTILAITDPATGAELKKIAGAAMAFGES